MEAGKGRLVCLMFPPDCPDPNSLCELFGPAGFWKVLDSDQAGFRSGRSTTDQLVASECCVKNAFASSLGVGYCMFMFILYVYTFFNNLEQAYDTAWRFSILKSFDICENRLDSLICLNGHLEGLQYLHCICKKATFLRVEYLVAHFSWLRRTHSERVCPLQFFTPCLYCFQVL